MYERRRARILLAVLTLVSLALVTIDARAGDDGPLSRVRDGVAAVFGPVEEGMATVLRPVADVFGGVGELFRIRQENALLRDQLEELRDRTQSFADVLNENEELRELLDMRDSLIGRAGEFEFLAARVTGFSPSNSEWTVTIDVGTRDGLTRDMTVINGDGLVGRVIQTGPTTSRVLLAVDHTFSAAARVARTGKIGYVRGRGKDPMQMTLLDPEAEVRPDDEIVTSSYQQALFPESIPIGAAAGELEGDGDLTREVRVRPFVDFTGLRTVLVILRAPPPDDAPLPTPGADEEPEFDVTPTAGAPGDPTADPTADATEGGTEPSEEPS